MSRMGGGSHAHAPRPTDLVALVTFGGGLHENQAVTRERLGRPPVAPRPLGTAIEQWLSGRRRSWVEVRGRQLRGIATARELATGGAWMIDALVDASGAPASGVAEALLQQALAAAARQRVTHVLLRLAVDAPARAGAARAGFLPVLAERLWVGPALRPPMPSEPHVAHEHFAAAPPALVREALPADAFALFQLRQRALPVGARQGLASTLAEWQQLQERRWLRRGQECVALRDGRVVAALRVAPAADRAQIDLVADPDALDAADALLDHAATLCAGAARVLALVPRGATALDALLRERGLEPGAEYLLLAGRTVRPLARPSRVTQGVAVSTDA